MVQEIKEQKKTNNKIVFRYLRIKFVISRHSAEKLLVNFNLKYLYC